MPKMTTCLWFDKGEAREAAEFYASVFPDTHVGSPRAAVSDYPGGHQGDELTVEFTLLGQPFVGLNGGPNFKPNEAVTAGGGQILFGPMEIPGGEYSLNGLDPQGAAFGLVGPRK